MTNSVTLREVADEDIPALVELLQHPDVREWWGDYDEAKLRGEVADPGHRCWTIEIDGEPGGLLEVTEEREPEYKHVALDIFIGAQHHGKGLGGEALRIMLRHMFDQHDHHRATIDPVVGNERAIRSYERVGFKPVGVLRKADRTPDGRFNDVLLMDLLAEELS